MDILVVDDHAMFAESLKLLLGVEHNIQTVGDGSSAIECLSGKLPDIILLDHGLPDADGLTLLRVIQAMPKPPPVLVLSATGDQSIINSARALGAKGYVHKSMHPRELLNAIRIVENGGTTWSELTIPADSVDPSDAKYNQKVAEKLGLTERQMDVLIELCQGLSNKMIARELGIAESTVKSHMKTLFSVLGVSNRVACTNKASELGLFLR
ncbi:MAG: response regulator transcription factor [Gammaproteobacteria bacterium]|nr:response regulator transcription factor [Gammaproteobacteria bacterium]